MRGRYGSIYIHFPSLPPPHSLPLTPPLLSLRFLLLLLLLFLLLLLQKSASGCLRRSCLTFWTGCSFSSWGSPWRFSALLSTTSLIRLGEVCLSVLLSVCMPICVFLCLSVCLSICSVCLSACLPASSVSVCLPVCLSVFPPSYTNQAGLGLVAPDFINQFVD